MPTILAIDPGTTESGWCLFDGAKVLRSGQATNPHMLELVKQLPADVLASEMIASYGMPVGREVFETCVWIGRFVQAWNDPDAALLVYRADVKHFLCGSSKAKDPNVRQALLDLFGPVGTKKSPGPLYGVSGHVWSALGVAATVAKVKRARAVVAGVQELAA